MAMPATGLHAGGTQHMSLSATNVQTGCKHRHVGTKRIVLIMEVSFCVRGRNVTRRIVRAVLYLFQIGV